MRSAVRIVVVSVKRNFPQKKRNSLSALKGSKKVVSKPLFEPFGPKVDGIIFSLFSLNAFVIKMLNIKLNLSLN